MSLTLEQKQTVVAEVNAVAREADAAIAADYKGLTVAQLTELRAKARASGVYLRVVKNSLARRALAETDFNCLEDNLVGPVMLVFSRDDPGAGARVVRDFAKDNQKLVTKAIVVGGVLRGAEDLKAIAALPTLDEARAQLLGMLQAPMSKLVRTLAEPPSQFVRVLAAHRDSQPVS